jgi:hypothetical protein
MVCYMDRTNISVAIGPISDTYGYSAVSISLSLVNLLPQWVGGCVARTHA